MSGDFAERLAAVDDAIEGASSERTGEECAASGDAGRSRSDGGHGVGGHERDVRVGDSGARPPASESRGDAVGSGPGTGGVGSESGVDADVVALADRVAELEAAVQALRGYAGSVRAVNDRVEERADAAVATADDCRERLAALERRVETSDGGGGPGPRRDGGSGREPRRGPSDAGPGRTRRGDAEEGPGEAGEVPWPPAAPRAPYEPVDADDDREQGGLLARLRNAL